MVVLVLYTAFANPLIRFMNDSAAQISNTTSYVDSILV